MEGFSSIYHIFPNMQTHLQSSQSIAIGLCNDVCYPNSDMSYMWNDDANCSKKDTE